MNEQLHIFNNPQFGEVRVAGTNEQPLFCLADVCKATELTNPSSVKSRLDPSDVQLVDLHALNSIEGVGNSTANFITESGFYDVLLQSSSPKVKPFRKWVTSEVLPTIRKHGGYLTPEKVAEALLNPDTLIQLATSLKHEQAQRRLAESKADLLEQVTRDQAPKVLFANAVETSQKSILIGELAKILCQNGINIGQNRLFEWLRQHDYLGTRGEYYNLPTQRAMDLVLFEIKKTTVNKPDGSILVSNTVKVTGKGQVYFVNKFLCAKVA